MPVQPCKRDGKRGWRWGQSGKCYLGAGARAKAAKQGAAIRASGWAGNQRAPNPLRRDPTRMATLKRRFITELNRRLNRIKRAIYDLVVTEDAFGLSIREPTIRDFLGNTATSHGASVPQFQPSGGGLSTFLPSPGGSLTREISPLTDNATGPLGVHSQSDPGSGGSLTVVNQRFRFATTDQKVRLFEEWLKQQFTLFLSSQEAIQDAYWHKFVEEGYRKGAGRAFDDTRAAQRVVAEDPREYAFYEGTKEEFLRSSFARPESVAKVKLLAGRTFDELQGFTDATRNTLRRTLLDGLAQGWGARKTARELSKAVDVSRSRASTIARTELVRAHAEGAIDSMERLGVEKVGVMVEWSTAGFNVCPLCAPMEGVVMTLKEMRGLIPRHPNAVFEGSTFASYGHTQELVRARYSGPSVVLLAGDKRTAIGPHHPMMTRRGMVVAAEIKEGDEILYDHRVDSLPRSSDVFQVDCEKIPKIEDVFDSSVPIGEHPFIASPGSDLHGDRSFCKGKVEAIRPTGSLLVVFDSFGIEQFREGDLVFANTELEGMSCFGSGNLDRQLVNLAVSGGMSRSHVGVATDFEWLPVRRVSFQWFDGWAFDGTTDSSIYCNNGFVVSNCACSPIPANVGEPQDRSRTITVKKGKETTTRTIKGQTRGKEAVERALDRSVAAEIPKTKPRSLERQKELTRWPGADKRIVKDRPKSPLD